MPMVFPIIKFIGSAMAQRQDLTGNQYGDLLVLKFSKSFNHNRLWLCKCSCGNICEKSSDQLSAKNTAKHCGCKTKPANLIGRRFGKLVVLEQVKNYRGSLAWKCRCDCGNEIIQETSALTYIRKITNNTNTLSCGCSRGVYGIDLTGKRFGKLVVIEALPSNKRNKKWKCQCDCGNITTPTTSALIKNKSAGCGCGVKDYFKAYRIAKGKNPDVSIQEKLCKLRGDISGTHYKILNRDNNKCVLCLSQISNNNKLYDHHIIPLAHDETLYKAMTNRITLCKACHHLAHDNNWQKLNTSIQKILFQIIEWYITDKTIKD